MITIIVSAVAEHSSLIDIYCHSGFHISSRHAMYICDRICKKGSYTRKNQILFFLHNNTRHSTRKLCEKFYSDAWASREVISKIRYNTLKITTNTLDSYLFRIQFVRHDVEQIGQIVTHGIN